MRVFFKYLIVNILSIFFHVVMFFIAAMGFGGRTGTESDGELLYHILLISLIGILPNLLVFLAALIRKKNIRQNALWVTVFSLTTIIGYILVYSVVLGMWDTGQAPCPTGFFDSGQLEGVPLIYKRFYTKLEANN